MARDLLGQTLVHIVNGRRSSWHESSKPKPIWVWKTKPVIRSADDAPIARKPCIWTEERQLCLSELRHPSLVQCRRRTPRRPQGGPRSVRLEPTEGIRQDARFGPAEGHASMHRSLFGSRKTCRRDGVIDRSHEYDGLGDQRKLVCRTYVDV